jgi:hypothetical protein
MNNRAMPLLAALALGAAPAANVRAQSAAIGGLATAEGTGAPVTFALVRLVRVDTGGAPSVALPQGITGADGRYWFGGVAAGRYRVQLLRIGFRPVLSNAVQVAEGETVQVPIRAASEPLTLPAITVASGACVTIGELAAHPQLEALWQQARGGASIREGLMGRFRYELLVREVGSELTADGPTSPDTLDRTIVNDPQRALRNLALNRAHLLSRGYRGRNDGWALPNELNVLHEDFLKSHCVVTVVERGDGEVGLRFAPIRPRRNFLDVAGTIWLDSATYLARRIELEYVDGGEPRGTVRLDFADIEVAGAMLRMPVGGMYAMRASRKNPAKRTQGTLTFTYSGFEELPRR